MVRGSIHTPAPTSANSDANETILLHGHPLDCRAQAGCRQCTATEHLPLPYRPGPARQKKRDGLRGVGALARRSDSRFIVCRCWTVLALW